MNRKCKGRADDEEELYNEFICDDTQFRCLSDSICIPLEELCDGQVNCADQSDESSSTCATVDYHNTEHATESITSSSSTEAFKSTSSSTSSSSSSSSS